MSYDFTLRVAGESGEGVITIGETVGRLAAREGLNLITFRTFPAEIKGGPCMIQLRLSDQKVAYHGEKVDCLVTLNQAALDENIADLREDGVLLCEAECELPAEPSSRTVYQLPFDRLAVREIGSRISKNIVVLGALAHLLKIPKKRIEEFLTERFARKGQAILEHNRKALETGTRVAEAKVSPKNAFRFPKGTDQARMLITGNEAIALGATVAGMRYFFGYPITPASEIMEWLAAHLPKLGGKVLQTEDEISAICGVAGASWAGGRAMTATSGPGVSLMSETIGLLSIAEIPAVIVDSQRGGPSTGMPTKTEQSDLLLAVYGSHGDAPRLVIAPIEECLSMIGLAFDLAEKYQLPAIFLVDQALSARLETVDPAAAKRAPAAARLCADGGGVNNFARYRLGESAVSPAAIPGTPRCEHMVTGMEHDELGNFACDDETHTAMTVKRFRKLAAVESDPLSRGLSSQFGDSNADIGIVTWGSSAGPVEEAVKVAEQQGIAVRAIVPKILNPLPHEELRRFFQSVKKVIVPELNFVGQFASLLRSTYRIPTISLTKIKGVPLEPSEILSVIGETAASLSVRRTSRYGSAR
ncbi:MAG: 2-oxoacid:acceptor oxidoreductase subunit alpha [Deltaproteobacteria bacterium]|nr:2-oxoacid:acceptor oxidoreductase subunit alpha [Deltaproteobacteria bacterium]